MYLGDRPQGLISFSTQPLRKVCIANRNIGQFCLNNLVLYSVLFRFGHMRSWDQCAVYILYSKISTDPGLLKIRHSHRFVAVVIQFLILPKNLQLEFQIKFIESPQDTSLDERSQTSLSLLNYFRG